MIKTVSIKGKSYAMVHERVNHFRENYPGYAIETEVVDFDQEKGFCITKATVRDESARALATGLAHEFRDDRSSMVNKTSFVENAETSAIGRALACLGIGTEDSYASSFEVENAIARKEAKPEPAPAKTESESATIIPAAVKTFGGRKLDSLDMAELVELSTIATSEEWKSKIAAAMADISKIEKAEVGQW